MTLEPTHRRLTSLILPVAQALDLLRVAESARPATVARWRLAGWIDSRGEVDLALAGPTVGAVKPAPTRAKPKPARRRMTPAELESRVQQLVKAKQPTVTADRRERAYRRLSERCGVVYGC